MVDEFIPKGDPDTIILLNVQCIKYFPIVYLFTHRLVKLSIFLIGVPGAPFHSAWKLIQKPETQNW